MWREEDEEGEPEREDDCAGHELNDAPEDEWRTMQVSNVSKDSPNVYRIAVERTV